MAKGKKNGSKKVATKKAAKKSPVSAQDFIAAWQKGTSVKDVASKLGLTTASTYQRAAKYRKRGVKSLKVFPSGPRGATPLNVSELESIAKKLKSASA